MEQVFQQRLTFKGEQRSNEGVLGHRLALIGGLLDDVLALPAIEPMAALRLAAGGSGPPAVPRTIERTADNIKGRNFPRAPTSLRWSPTGSGKPLFGQYEPVWICVRAAAWKSGGDTHSWELGARQHRRGSDSAAG
jgi:hypothetical protein